jgi:hypothetical protein
VQNKDAGGRMKIAIKVLAFSFGLAVAAQFAREKSWVQIWLAFMSIAVPAFSWVYYELCEAKG